MNLSLFLFLIGILGFILNRKNIILMIIAIEIMLLAVTLLVLISSFSFDDGIGQIFSIFIISIAGAESVIGLSILVAFYRLRGNICPIPSSKLNEFIKTNKVTANSIISIAIIIRIIFFLFNIKPNTPIKNKNIDRFIIRFMYFLQSFGLRVIMALMFL